MKTSSWPCRYRAATGRCRPQAKVAQRQRFVLHRRRTRRLAHRTRGWLSPWRTEPSADPGQDRALAPTTLKNRVLLENYYLPSDLESQHWRLRRTLQPPPLPRKPRQPHPRRRLLRPAPDHHRQKEKDQRPDYPNATLGPSVPSRLSISQDEPEPPLDSRLTCPIHSDGQAGPKRAGWCPRSNGTSVSYTHASASLIFAPQMATMIQKSSLPQLPLSVP